MRWPWSGCIREGRQQVGREGEACVSALKPPPPNAQNELASTQISSYPPRIAHDPQEQQSGCASAAKRPGATARNG